MHTVAWISIAVSFLCLLIIAADELRHPQRMSVMNVVWPVTALYFSVFAVWAYFRVGRRKAKDAPGGDSMQSIGTGSQGKSSQGKSGQAKSSRGEDAGKPKPPTLTQTAVGTSHCGAGCMCADVLCEFAIAAAGLTLLGSVLWAEYAIDFAAAWALGIVFQYFAIKPMTDKTPGEAILAAIKADTLSILAFQVGMYAWMALVFFKLFPHPHLTPFDPRYWLMMQIAMVCGYATAFPMNYILIRAGLKEAM